MALAYCINLLTEVYQVTDRLMIDHKQALKSSIALISQEVVDPIQAG